MSTKLPRGWKSVVVSQVAEVRLSGVDKKTVIGERSVRLCNYMDVFYNETIDPSLNFMVATASQTEIERFALRRGDVLLTKDSETADEIAECAVVAADLPDVLCGYHLALLRPNVERVLGGYLAIALREPRVRSQFANCANGVTRFGLTLDAFDQVEIVLPPLVEQERISSVHATLSGRIVSTMKLVDRLTEQRRGLMQKLLSGELRLASDLSNAESAHA